MPTNKQLCFIFVGMVRNKLPSICWRRVVDLMKRISMAKHQYFMLLVKTDSTCLSSFPMKVGIIPMLEFNHVDKLAKQTPLYYCARKGHFEMCKALIERGCNANHLDSHKKTPVEYAKKARFQEVADYLQM